MWIILSVCVPVLKGCEEKCWTGQGWDVRVEGAWWEGKGKEAKRRRKEGSTVQGIERKEENERKMEKEEDKRRRRKKIREKNGEDDGVKRDWEENKGVVHILITFHTFLSQERILRSCLLMMSTADIKIREGRSRENETGKGRRAGRREEGRGDDKRRHVFIGRLERGRWWKLKRRDASPRQCKQLHCGYSIAIRRRM